MKSFGTLIMTAALVLAPLAVHAQAEKPAATKADPEAKAGAPKRSRSDTDARKCLEFSTNMEIHKCAEKYR